MPRYDYLCKANGQVVEVTHSISEKMKNWGEVCELASLELGDLSADEPVEKIILTAPMANTPIGDAGIKDLSFTKPLSAMMAFMKTSREPERESLCSGGDPPLCLT